MNITYKMTKREYEQLCDIVNERMFQKRFDITSPVWVIVTDNDTLVSVRDKCGLWTWESEWYKTCPDDYKQHLYQIGGLYDTTEKLENLLDYRIQTK